MPVFNTQQRAAVEHPLEPLLIIAGAGTGKTTTIVGRIAYFIQNKGASPESILALTFTNDAAKQLKNKLVDVIGEPGNLIDVCTFHSFAQLQTNKYYDELGYSVPPQVMNRGGIYFLLRQNFDNLKQLKSKIFRRNPIKAIQCFQRVFEAFRQNLLTKSELKKLQTMEMAAVKSTLDEKELEKIHQLVDMVDY